MGVIKCDGITLALLLAAVMLPWHPVLAATIKLVSGGNSEYCIYRSVIAPSSVDNAAKDLQRYISRATETYLPIVGREEHRCHGYIRLGDPALVAGLPYEAYRIMTRNGDVFIAGVDTRDGELTPTGGTSNGTRNGVYTFLEEFVGVRWLMPGEVGEDVPTLKGILIPDVDRVDTPGFENRRIPYIQNDEPFVWKWLQRQKQGFSLQLNHYHNFRHLVPAEEFNKHPNWFAQLNGQRQRPSDRYKIETTNPEMVRFVVRRVSAELRRTPAQYSYSISPSDSSGWSTSPESFAFYDRDPHDRVSVTPLVLDFYRNVAKNVGKTFKDRVLCGYIYADYLYPPSQGVPKLPDNLCLVLAPSISYGYGLYRTETRYDLDSLLRSWSKATSLVAYYDLPVNLLQSFGAPNPPGLEILSYLYPRLAAAGMRGVYMYGVSAWGQGALTNYLLAKLNWNPHADVDALTKEFFLRAYGREAGPIMQELYARVDAANKQFHVQYPEAKYRLTLPLLQMVYLPHLAGIQRLFDQALHSAMTPPQRQRLWMFQVNMNRFMHYMQDVGLAELERTSVFSDAAIEAARPVHALSGLELALAAKPDAEDEPVYKMRLRLMRDSVVRAVKGE